MQSTQQALRERFVLNADDFDDWEWLSRNHVAATDAAKLASKNSIDGIVTRKYNPYELTGNAIRWGIEREPKILEQLGLAQNRDMFHSAQNKGFLAMPDAIFEKDGQLAIAQVKTTIKDFKKIPKAYMRQVQWETFVAGASGCLFAWETHENYQVISLKSVWVERNEEMISQLIKLGADLLKTLEVAKLQPFRYIQQKRDWWY
jgi:hypothetical protein